MIALDRRTAFSILEELRTYGFSDSAILDYIIGNNLPANVALSLMKGVYEEFVEEDKEEKVRKDV